MFRIAWLGLAFLTIATATIASTSHVGKWLSSAPFSRNKTNVRVAWFRLVATPAGRGGYVYRGFVLSGRHADTDGIAIQKNHWAEIEFKDNFPFFFFVRWVHWNGLHFVKRRTHAWDNNWKTRLLKAKFADALPNICMSKYGNRLDFGIMCRVYMAEQGIEIPKMFVNAWIWLWFLGNYAYCFIIKVSKRMIVLCERICRNKITLSAVTG